MKHTKRMRKKGEHQRSKPYIFIPPLVVSWLQQNYVAHPDGIVNKEEMYKRYELYCKDNDIAPKRNNIFGKILRTVFPTIHSRRLGPTGGGVPHYGGIVSCNPDEETQPASTSSLPSLELLSRAASSLAENSEGNEARPWEKVPTALPMRSQGPTSSLTASFPRIVSPQRDNSRNEEPRVIRHRRTSDVDYNMGFFKAGSSSFSTSSSPTPRSPNAHGTESEGEDTSESSRVKGGYESPLAFENRHLQMDPQYWRERPTRSPYENSYDTKPQMAFPSRIPTDMYTNHINKSLLTTYARAYREKMWPLAPLHPAAYDCTIIESLFQPGNNEKSVNALCANVALYFGALCCEDFTQARTFFKNAQEISTHLQKTLDLNYAQALVFMAHGTWRFYPASEAMDMAVSYVSHAVSICDSLQARDSDVYQRCAHFYSTISKEKLSVSLVKERVNKCCEIIGVYTKGEGPTGPHARIRDVQSLISTAEAVMAFVKTSSRETVDILYKDLDALRRCLDIAYSIVCEDASIMLAKVWIISASAELQLLLGEHDKALRTATFFLRTAEECATYYGSGHLSSVILYFDPVLDVFLRSNSEHLIRHTLSLFERQNLLQFNNVYTLVDRWRTTLSRYNVNTYKPATLSHILNNPTSSDETIPSPLPLMYNHNNNNYPRHSSSPTSGLTLPPPPIPMNHHHHPGPLNLAPSGPSMPGSFTRSLFV